jgi:hypothetical protein
MSPSTEHTGLATDNEVTNVVTLNEQSNVSDIMCWRRNSVIDYTTVDSENTKKAEFCDNPSHQVIHVNKEAQEHLDPTLIDLLDGQTVKYHFNRVATSNGSGSLLMDGFKSHNVLLTLPDWYDKQELPSLTQRPGERRSRLDEAVVSFLVDQADSNQKVRMVTDDTAKVVGYHQWAIIDGTTKAFGMGFKTTVLKGEPVRNEYTYDPGQTSFEIVRPSTEYTDFMSSPLGKQDNSWSAFQTFKKNLIDDEERVPDRSKVISWCLGPLIKDENGKDIYSRDRDTGVTTQRREITYYLPIPCEEAEHHNEV